MQIKFFNKSVKPRQFGFLPRYYDERKERLELKKAEFNRLTENDLPSDEREMVLRQHMKESWSRAQHAQQQKYFANVRTVVIIVVILVLGYFIFNGMDQVDTVVKKLM
ncbi:MAG: hypothetical protein ACK45H_13345 [Bacteroidota bacterium]|jgi:hypothetical protein